jgi:hypothetical protein
VSKRVTKPTRPELPRRYENVIGEQPGALPGVLRRCRLQRLAEASFSRSAKLQGFFSRAIAGAVTNLGGRQQWQ